MAKMGRKVAGYLYKRGGVWWVDWQAFGVRNRKSTGISVGEKGAKELARAKMEEWVGAYKAEDVADVRASLAQRQRDAQAVAEERMEAVAAAANRIPLAEAWTRHPYTMSQQTRGRTRVHPLSPANIAENRGAWDKFVRWVSAAHGDGLAMQDITAEWAAEWSRALQADGLSPQRHNKLLTTAGVMYRLAGLPSPFAGVAKLREAEAEHREPFTKEQVARLLDAAEGEWRGFLAVLYFTGLRRKDVALLRWEWRNPDTGRWLVVPYKSKTKTVALCEHPFLTAILRESGELGRSGYVFPGIAADYKRNPTLLSQRFEAFMGRVLGFYENGTWRPFDGTADRHGSGKYRVSRYGLHSFRHSFASHAAQAGIPLGRIQAWLGHSSAEITRIYTHYGDTAEQARVMEAICPPLAGFPASRALLPPSAPESAPAANVDGLRALLDDMTDRNWKQNRDAALRLLASSASESSPPKHL